MDTFYHKPFSAKSKLFLCQSQNNQKGKTGCRAGLQSCFELIILTQIARERRLNPFRAMGVGGSSISRTHFWSEAQQCHFHSRVSGGEIFA